jgi:quinoprotein glucose dehydrogenase
MAPHPAWLAALALALQEPATEEPAPYSPTVQAASEEGAAAMKSFELAAGLTVELFAAEPMLANPVCFTVDGRGDFYVAETFRHHAGVTDIREHMDWLDDDLAARSVADRVAYMRKHEGEGFAAYSTEHERIRRIRDTDGDGTADEAVVFADGFSDPEDGIAAGLLVRGDDVYYTCMPDLWKLNDTDGDGRADEREVLSTGYGIHIALLGHDLHGLIQGMDGYIYFSCGDRAFRVETEDGVIDHHHTGAVLRCEPDGSKLEVVHTGLRNPQELAFDDYGNLFTGDNNSDGGDRARWVQIVPGADSGWRYAYQWITAPVSRGPWNDEKLWHPFHEGQAAYVLPPIANLADGPSGLAHYPGTGLGDEYRGKFLLCDFRGGASFSGIHAFGLEPAGATFTLGPVERFAWKVLATDVGFGPDGGVYLTDWTQGWNKTGKGRLYRIASPEHRQSELVLATKALLAAGMSARPVPELAELLAHPDRRVRLEAHLELATRGEPGVAALLETAAASPDPLARLHGVWGAGVAVRRNGADPARLVALLDHADPLVRVQVLRAIHDLRATTARDAVIARLADDDVRVRFHAALALGRIGDASAVEPLRALVAEAGPTDPYLRHAAVHGLVGSTADTPLDALSNSESADERMAAVLVFRRRGSSAAMGFLGDAEPAVELEAVRALYDEGSMPSLAAVAGLLRREALAGNALVRRALNAAFLYGGADSARDLAAFALRDGAELGHRVEALELLRDWRRPGGRDRFHGAWREPWERDGSALDGVVEGMLLGGVLDAPDDVLEAWIHFARAASAFPMGVELRALVLDDARASAIRVAALETLEEFGHPSVPGLVDVALAGVDGSLRASALGVLERLAPEDALPRLPRILAHGEIRERRAAYGILARAATGDAAELLRAELARHDQGLVPAELLLDLEDAALANGLLAPRVALPGDSPLYGYAHSLFGGDADAGRRVFEDVDLSCLRCHATTDSEEVRIGPDLRGVGGRLTRLQMLESIVTPNAWVTPGFQGSVLFLKKGQPVAGRVIEDTAERIRVLTSNGDVIEVDPANVDERLPDLSAMPDGLAESISKREMRDLLEYLSRL